MKKLKIVLSVALAILAVSCGSNEESKGEPRIVTDLEADELRGAVKSVVFGDNKSKKVYNNQGWVVEEYESEFGKNILRIKSKTIYAEDGSTMVGGEVFKYSWDKKMTSRKVDYDNITAEQRAKNALSDDKIYQFNSDGYLVKSIEYSGGNNKHIKTYTYDGYNRVVEYIFEVLSPSNTEKNQKIFNSEDFTDADLVKVEFGEIRSYNLLKNEYNDKGDVSVKTTFDQDGEQKSRTEYTYTYDANGNWIERTYNLLKNKKEIETRTIEYF